MFNFKTLRKFDFFLSLIIALGFVYMSITGYVGIDFPEENELNYTTGVYSIVEEPEYVNHIMLSQIDESNDNKLFTCSYSPFGNGQLSSCGHKDFLDHYAGNVVTIGWYEQKEFLGFKNDIAQMVTTEMNGEIMRSYDQTDKFVEDIGNSVLYIDMPISILSFPFFYWLFGRLTKAGNEAKKVNLEK